jgi:hypothetical protein
MGHLMLDSIEAIEQDQFAIRSPLQAIFPAWLSPVLIAGLAGVVAGSILLVEFPPAWAILFASSINILCSLLFVGIRLFRLEQARHNASVQMQEAHEETQWIIGRFTHQHTQDQQLLLLEALDQDPTDKQTHDRILDLAKESHAYAKIAYLKALENMHRAQLNPETMQFAKAAGNVLLSHCQAARSPAVN